MVNISERGIDLITRFEGFRSNWYQCSANVWTIGYGHAEKERDGRVSGEDLPTGYEAPLSEEEAAEGFLRWEYVDGEVSEGLLRRRKAEAALYREEPEAAFNIEPEPIDPAPVQPVPVSMDLDDPDHYPIRSVGR